MGIRGRKAVTVYVNPVDVKTVQEFFSAIRTRGGLSEYLNWCVQNMAAEIRRASENGELHHMIDYYIDTDEF